MIIEVEDQFYKSVQAFQKVLALVEVAAKRGDAVHEVEESVWKGLLKTGREIVSTFVQKQAEDVPRPEVIECEGKLLKRLPEQRTRQYVSVFGPVPFDRDVYAIRETQLQEVVPLDAKLGMPQSDTSYLLQKWSGAHFVKESYKESRVNLQMPLGFAPSVNCLEDIAARASEHAEAYFAQQAAVDPATEAEIFVLTSDCKGVPMRKADASRRKKAVDEGRKRLGKGEKYGQKRMACVGGVYTVAPFCRTADDILDEMLRKQKQPQRPKPQNKRLRALLTRDSSSTACFCK